MNDSVDSAVLAEPGVKRLNKLPLTIAFVLIGAVFIVFAYALIQRMGTSDRRSADVETAESQVVETADSSQINNSGPAVGTIPPTLQPLPTEPVNSFGGPSVGYQPTPDRQKLAGASQTEQEALSEMRMKNAIENESYYLQQIMEKKRYRDSAAQQALTSPMNVAYDNGDSVKSGASPSAGASRFGSVSGASPTSFAAGTFGVNPAGGQNPVDAQNQALAALTAAGGAAGAGGNNNPNRLSEKRDFASNASTDQDYLVNDLVAPLSPYEIKQGTIIPALMVTGVNSDLPGFIIGQVSQNVYDSVTGTTLLLPQGTKIFGQYDSGVTFGQNRVLIVWNRLILPNGKAINVDTMVGSDAQGRSGIKDKVNRHLVSLYGQAILLSAISGATEAFTDSSDDDDLERAIQREFGDGIEDTSRQIIEREIARAPTIEVRPGKKFVILVDQDIILEPYENRSTTRR